MLVHGRDGVPELLLDRHAPVRRRGLHECTRGVSNPSNCCMRQVAGYVRLRAG